MRAESPHGEKLVPAQKGNTLKAGGAFIHSRYDPASEAEKYIVSLGLKAYPYFILVEPGLGYLAAALGKIFPESRVITLHCSPFFNELPVEPSSWNPASAESLEDFLEGILENTDAAEIKLVEWKPSVNVYGKAALELAARTVECIRRISAGRKTARNFGRRWIANALRNLERFGGGAELERGSVPVLVCAAGPSLEDSLPYIGEWKQSPAPPFLIAVASAAPALLRRGITPDLIVSTDGGSWALFHLIESRRYQNQNRGREQNSAALSGGENPAIAAAMTAALPSNLASWPLVLIRDGSLWQELLAREAGAALETSPVFPQRGTVSVTAIDLAFYASRGDVYVCGLDFAHRDLQTHSRPYAFERFHEENAFRTAPRYSQVFEREAMIRASGSLGIYASWLQTHLDSYPKRLFTIGPSVHGIPVGLPSKNKAGKKITVAFRPNTVQQNLVQKTSGKQLAGVLLESIDNPLLSAQLCNELGELLVDGKPAGEKALAASVKNALLELL